MDSKSIPFDVSKELAALRHEKKNHTMKKLPVNTTIAKRPLNHPAIASPHAGPHVEKVVYVSRRTPFMSAVKRVKKLLAHVEKRALQSVDSKLRDSPPLDKRLAAVSDKLAKSREEVLVKASGRAMEQALKIGEWFRSKESDYSCNVEVRTGSVAAVDDIVVMEKDEDLEIEPDGNAGDVDGPETTLEGGDTTMDLLGDKSAAEIQQQHSDDANQTKTGDQVQNEDSKVPSKRRKRKRKRATYDEDNLPEARIRWVKTVEVAISLRA